MPALRDIRIVSTAKVATKNYTPPSAARIPMSLDELAGGERPTTKVEFREVFGIPAHTISKWARERKIVKFNLGTKQAYFSLRSFLQLLESARSADLVQ